MFDALIVGGGPAGAAVALRLRAQGGAGLRVAIVDRAQFPRDKPCGEGMLPTGVAVLGALGLGDAFARLEAPAIRAVEFVLDGRRARGALPAHGAGVDRRRLDAMLAAATRDAGVTWIEDGLSDVVRDASGRVRGVRLASGRTVEAAVVVGADGLRSATRRALSLGEERAGEPRFGLCARVEVPGAVGDSVEVHIVPDVGELYVTPTGPHQLSIALLATRSNVTALRGRLATAVDAAIVRSPSLALRLAGATPAGRPSATGPLATRAIRPWGSGALLAGDAARAIDPIGGDGISVALAGSAACARAVRSLLAGDEEATVGRAYSAALGDVTFRRTAFVAGLLVLTARPRAARAVIAGLSRAPALVSAICALHEGAPLS